MEINHDVLASIFAGRPGRFRLLDAGVSTAGWADGAKLLEVGCNTGDAAAHLAKCGFDVVAIDLERGRTNHAAETYQGIPGCIFLQADACELPFENGVFNGIYSEAAFSVIPNKTVALAEYRRCLNVGGMVLINDFATENIVADEDRASVRAVPCFAGALTIPEYCDMFSAGGFKEIIRKREFFEFASIFTRLSKLLGVDMHHLGGYLADSFGGNAAEGERFFEKAKLTYCQLVFEKV